MARCNEPTSSSRLKGARRGAQFRTLTSLAGQRSEGGKGCGPRDRGSSGLRPRQINKALDRGLPALRT